MRREPLRRRAEDDVSEPYEIECAVGVVGYDVDGVVVVSGVAAAGEVERGLHSGCGECRWAELAVAEFETFEDVAPGVESEEGIGGYALGDLCAEPVLEGGVDVAGLRAVEVVVEPGVDACPELVEQVASVATECSPVGIAEDGQAAAVRRGRLIVDVVVDGCVSGMSARAWLYCASSFWRNA